MLQPGGWGARLWTEGREYLLLCGKGVLSTLGGGSARSGRRVGRVGIWWVRWLKVVAWAGDWVSPHFLAGTRALETFEYR